MPGPNMPLRVRRRGVVIVGVIIVLGVICISFSEGSTMLHVALELRVLDCRMLGTV